jgi:hypothetical protein
VTRLAWILAVAGLGVATEAAGAQPPSAPAVPPIVTAGLEAYQAGGVDAALDAWLAGSPVEREPAAREGIRGLSTTLAPLYGKMIGSETLGVVAIGQSVRRVYIMVRYERGPAYAFFDCYRTPSGTWIIPAFLMNAQPGPILPATMLTPGRGVP